MTPIPLYLLTGYLGSGKTTLLNHLLAQEEVASQQVALLINEFGELGVDGQLVRGPKDVYELNSGSLFCACTRKGLVRILDRIATDIQPNMVLAESTGVAETSDLYDVLETEPLAGRFDIKANVCVVDGFNFTKILPNLRAARTQVATADGVVVNKTDLLDETALTRLGELLRDLNPRAEQFLASHGRLPWECIDRLRHVRCTSEVIQQAPEDIATCSFSQRRAVQEHFRAAVEQLGPHLLRLKGIVDFGNGLRLVESIFGNFSDRPLDDTVVRPGTTVLGWRIEREELVAAFEGVFLPDQVELNLNTSRGTG